MAAEEGIQLGRVINSIGLAAEVDKQAEIIKNAFAQGSIRQGAEYWLDIAKRALDDLGYAKAFLMLLDVPVLNKVMGKKTVASFEATFKSNDKFSKLTEIIEQMSHMDVKTVKAVKAKSAGLFQLIYLVADRIKEEGLPPIKVQAPEVVLRVIADPEVQEKKIKFNLNDYGKAYWSIMIDQLKEADFRTKDNEIYEMLLTDSLINQYENGSILAASGAGGAGEARLSDAVLARFGTNIIKRLNLLLRTTQMYQSVDHPSVTNALESLLATIENALQGRESLTFTRLGGDLLIEDIKVKKHEKFLDDFVAALEVRNVNSMTLKTGLTVEEVRAFLLLFAETEAQIKKRGGVKKVLEQKGVSHVLVDQFKYGIIADDHEDGQPIASDEKMLENIVFTELVTKIRKGEVGDINPDEMGQAFKQLLSGQYRQDPNVRKSLAQMILALDPELAEQAIFSKVGIRDEMSWSTASKMIDQLLADIEKGSTTDRIHTLDNLVRMAELAITRNKETTLVLIVDKLSERLRYKERDIDVLNKLFETMANIARFLIVNAKYAQALKVLRALVNLRNYCENLPADKKDSYTRAVCELSATAMLNVSAVEVVQALIRELDGEVMSNLDAAMKILETLGTEQVISELFLAFKSESRSLRNRCFQVLVGIGEKSLWVSNWKLKNLGDPGQFPRVREDGDLVDDGYYIARNCIDLLARMGGEKEVQIIRDISDDGDSRIRNEAIHAMTKLNTQEALILAKMRLRDSSQRVVEAAIQTIGQLGNEDDVSELVDLFYAEPELRSAIINALSRIGGKDSEKLLIGATHLRYGGALGKIFRENSPLRIAALKGTGNIGTEISRNALRRFVFYTNNLVLHLFFFSIRSASRKEMLRVAREAISRIEYRSQKGKEKNNHTE